MKNLFFVILAVLAVAVPQPASAQHLGSVIWATASPHYGGLYGYGGWYYDGYFGFQRQSGVKFDLDLVAKEDQKLVKAGIVVVDGNEDAIVNRHDGFWNGILPLPPGPHEIAIVLPDGRQFATQISVMAGRTNHVYPRFRKAEDLAQVVHQPAPPAQTAPQAQPPAATQPQAPAPPATAPAKPVAQPPAAPEKPEPRDASIAGIIRAMTM